MKSPLYTTIRPGLLVGLSTSIKGNVKYEKSETVESTLEDGKLIADWETTRITLEPKEQERAVEIRAKARSLVGSVCSATAFGFLCPEDDRALLDKAFAEAVALCKEFNRTAKVTRIKFAAITGRIAADDASAVQAINSEIRGLITDMKEGLQSLNAEAVRDAAKRTLELGNMLAPGAQAEVQAAVKAARSLATKIVKAATDQVAVEIDSTVLAKLDNARTSFLDLSEANEVSEVEDTTARAIDLAPHVAVEAPAEAVRDLELEDMLG